MNENSKTSKDRAMPTEVNDSTTQFIAFDFVKMNEQFRKMFPWIKICQQGLRKFLQIWNYCIA